MLVTKFHIHTEQQAKLYTCTFQLLTFSTVDQEISLCQV
jgi:hypothetical protein